MALASFSALSAPSYLLISSSSSKLMVKLAPLVPPYWKFSEPDTVLTVRLLWIPNSSWPVMPGISPLIWPARPVTV